MTLTIKNTTRNNNFNHNTPTKAIVPDIKKGITKNIAPTNIVRRYKSRLVKYNRLVIPMFLIAIPVDAESDSSAHFHSKTTKKVE